MNWINILGFALYMALALFTLVGRVSYNTEDMSDRAFITFLLVFVGINILM